MKNLDLKAARAKLGITQTELAEKVGTTKATINSIENCKSDPRLRLVARIANFFKLPINDLFSKNIENHG